MSPTPDIMGHGVPTVEAAPRARVALPDRPERNRRVSHSSIDLPQTLSTGRVEERKDGGSSRKQVAALSDPR